MSLNNSDGKTVISKDRVGAWLNDAELCPHCGESVSPNVYPSKVTLEYLALANSPYYLRKNVHQGPLWAHAKCMSDRTWAFVKANEFGPLKQTEATLDLPERLRDLRALLVEGGGGYVTCSEAADEIERLTKKLAEAITLLNNEAQRAAALWNDGVHKDDEIERLVSNQMDASALADACMVLEGRVEERDREIERLRAQRHDAMVAFTTWCEEGFTDVEYCERLRAVWGAEL